MYKLELRQPMVKLISEFFEIERGNKVTSFSIDGLLLKMGVVFDKHKELKKKKDDE